jgi:hypothetical protein
VLANCYLYAGEEGQSRAWYESARQSAVLDGDRATVGAIMYNRAALALARYRAEECLSIPHTLDIAAVSGAVLSATNFNVRTSNKALGQLLGMCEARLAMIEGRFDIALQMLECIRKSGFLSLSGVSEEFFKVEYSFCLIKAGNVQDVDCSLRGIEGWVIDKLDHDDKVVYLFELLTIFENLSIPINGENLSDLFKDAATAYVDATRRLQESLRRVLY